MSAPGPNSNIPINPFGTPGGVNLMSTGVNIAVSVLIGTCLLVGICAGFVRVRRQQRAHQAWLAQRQRGAINRAVQVFGTRLHDEEVALDPALNPYTPQPLLVVSPDGQDVAVARQLKDPGAAAGEADLDDASKSSAHHGLTAEGAEQLSHELDVASRQGMTEAASSPLAVTVPAAGLNAPPAGAGTFPPAIPQAPRNLLQPFGSRLKVKTYWSAAALLEPEPEGAEFSKKSEPVVAPADDVILEVRQNMEATRAGVVPTGPAAAAPEARPLGWISSLKAMVNPRQHFPEDGPLQAVPEGSAVSLRSRPGSLQRPSALRAASRTATESASSSRLAPLPAERQIGIDRQNPLLDSSRSEMGLLNEHQTIEMTRPGNQSRF